MSEKIKVISFNLRIAVKGDGVNYFDYRLPRIVEFMNSEKPDIIGFQEVNAHMKDLLNASLTDYVLIGCGREKDRNGESALIGYRKDRFELLSFENFWLSATPTIPGSRYGFDQSCCPRITSAALLKLRTASTPFWFVNTHLDHEGKLARVLGAMQIMQFVSSKAEPCVITGDFNALPDSPEIKLIVENKDYPIVEATSKVESTFHAFSPKLRGKIDYVFTSLKCDPDESVLYEDEPVDGVYLSDHRPVAAFVEVE
ncbi:MAG: endonuclease/exonuclease/phosphatase family protein [Ruminococcaceae bacterium]|nr:endonuclease/exonuclease/phosphatase family protein [Oscillospiraceae bacterium]